MVGCATNNGINVFVQKQFSVIGVAFYTVIINLASFFGINAIYQLLSFGNTVAV